MARIQAFVVGLRLARLKLGAFRAMHDCSGVHTHIHVPAHDHVLSQVQLSRERDHNLKGESKAATGAESEATTTERL